MHKKAVLVLPLILLLAGLAYLGESKSPSVSNIPTTVLSQAPTAIATPAASSNIELMMPKIADRVSSPFLVSGNARVFENVVSIKLVDDNGNVLASQNVTANSPDTGEFGPFEANISFENNAQATNGTLEAYQISARDGSETDKVTVPVSFK